jgi:hypothetical protein
MLQAFWKIPDGFVDFGSGRGIPVLFASFWAAFSAKEVNVPIVDIEKDPLRHSDSVMLLACGQYIAEQANCLHLRWPKVRLVLDDLNHESCWTNHQMFDFAKQHQDYSAMRLMYRPIFFAGVA